MARQRSYANIPSEGITKSEHDRLTAVLGRPLSQDPIHSQPSTSPTERPTTEAEVQKWGIENYNTGKENVLRALGELGVELPPAIPGSEE